ncbi:MAG: GNAT family N-acetyltransferase [Bacillota bacterium]
MEIKIKRLNNNFQDIIKDIIEIEEEAFGEGGLNNWSLPPFIYHGLVYIIQVDREVTGVIEYMRDFNDMNKAYLYGLAIDKEYQEQGLGSKLLEHSLKELKKQKINKVELTVEPDNDSAIELYKKFGFEKIAYRKAEYGPGEDRVIMKLSL